MGIEQAAQMAGNWWAQRLQQGDKEAFAHSIERRVLDAFLADPQRTLLHLECDYDPWDILLDAVHDAGIACTGMLFSARGILPSKHSLTVYRDRLRPKEGYGNWTAEIPVPEEPTV